MTTAPLIMPGIFVRFTSEGARYFDHNCSYRVNHSFRTDLVMEVQHIMPGGFILLRYQKGLPHLKERRTLSPVLLKRAGKRFQKKKKCPKAKLRKK